MLSGGNKIAFEYRGGVEDILSINTKSRMSDTLFFFIRIKSIRILRLKIAKI